MACWRAIAGGAELRIRATPGARADAIEGVVQDADVGSVLKVRVRAAPEKGRANAAIEALLAEALGLPRSAVSVEKGGASRIKLVRVAGDGAIAALTTLTGESDG